MNPENVGENIPLRHSMLWRKPLIYQKAVPESKICHLQLNELGASGQLWRTRNVEQQTRSRYSKKKNRSSSHQKSAQKQQKSPQGTSTSMTALNPTNQKGKKLVQSMEKLKESKLTEGGRFTLAAYPAVGKVNFICNDYHSKVTNAGYGRNIKGKHWTS